MCTAITFSAKDNYFGRNLDLEYNLQEAVTITPSNFPLEYRFRESEKSHYAIIGTATISQNYPLYYDAVNEFGLAMAGLNFVGNAYYNKPKNSKCNITTFELIPFILGSCKTVLEAEKLLETINITDTPFNNSLGLGYLHWIIADKTSSITVEPLKEGLRFYSNPIGVLTNNPPFPFHLQNLNQYVNLTPNDTEKGFADSLIFPFLSHGLGSIGLPGDLSSISRFVRAAYYKLCSVVPKTEEESVTQFFHILDSAFQTEGLTIFNEKFEKTVYSSCINTDKCIYYYKTYQNSRISKIDMFSTDYRGRCLISYPLIYKQSFKEIV